MQRVKRMVNTYINRAIHKMEKQTQEKKNTYIQVQTRTMDVIIHLPRRTIGLEALDTLEVLEALEARETLEALEIAACERGQKRATNEPCGRRMK